MSHSSHKIETLLDAEPEAIQAVIDFLVARNPPPTLTSLDRLVQLSTEKGRLELAAKVARAEFVSELKAVIHTMQQEHEQRSIGQ